jgi:hypothetical protein
MNRQPRKGDAFVPRELGLQDLTVSDEHDLVLVLQHFEGAESPCYLDSGGTIGSHGIQGDAHG